MTQSTSVKSFEEVYKTAYSHGLENIYALENVDIKTVRLLHNDGKGSEAPVKAVGRRVNQQKVAQSFFNFGMAYRTTLEHFTLKEPIQVLGLTRYIENSLLGQGKRTLRDLLNKQAAGFGQGHLDEIQRKLEEYLAGRHLVETCYVDFVSWLKATVGDVDKKKLYVALEPYGLQEHVALTTGENLELRRLTLEKRQEWREEANILMRTEAKKQQVDKEFWEITEVFIKPWMACRHGMATELELLEKLQQLSESAVSVKPVLDFFTDTYFKGAFPLNRCLEPLDSDLFASAGWVAERYDMIVERALTYFYNDGSVYRFDMLRGCLEREFAKEWIGYPDDFLTTVLKKCPLLYTYKASDGNLHIRLV